MVWPQVVAPEQLPAIMALRQVVLTTTQIVGPAAGGILIEDLAGGGVRGGLHGPVHGHDAAGEVAVLPAGPAGREDLGGARSVFTREHD